MVELSALLLPILLSAVVVFITSSIIHMLTPWHKSDYPKMPNEENVMNALRPFDVPPGDYMVPRAADMKDMKSPEFLDKMKKGPVMFLTMFPNGQPPMGKALLFWFVYSIVVGIFAGYAAGCELQAGTPYIHVFRLVATVAFLSYSLALWQMTIWYRRSWVTTMKSTIDGLIYALLTAGVFGWLWPR